MLSLIRQTDTEIHTQHCFIFPSHISNKTWAEFTSVSQKRPSKLSTSFTRRWFLLQIIWIFIKNRKLGLPWWCSGWESACQCRGHRFKPWSGKIPHAAEQLGPWATVTEPARLEPVLRNKRGRDSERPAHHNEEWPPLAATRESPRTETKTQHSQK